MSELTTRMMLSSMLGYIALGAAIAAFLPAVITNAVNRRSQTGPGFLAVWLIADIANLVGIILLGAAVTQVALAAWYFIIDGVMLVQLLIYGHDDLRELRRPPRKATALAKIHKRAKWPGWQSLTRHFEEFDTWDNVKLLGFCVVGSIAAWGVYMTLGYANPETFAIKIPEGFHPLSFGLGMTAILIFTLARVPEVWSGYQRSKRGEKPEHTLTDALWWFLIFENFFNLTAILTLSLKQAYLLAELPFILGAVLPILFDCGMLFAISSWQREWGKSKTKAALDAKEDEKKVQEELDLLDQERRDLVAMAKLQEIKREAGMLKDHSTADAEKRAEMEAIDAKTRQARHDFLSNESALRALENQIANRRRAAARRFNIRARQEASRAFPARGNSEARPEASGALPARSDDHGDRRDSLVRRSTHSDP